MSTGNRFFVGLSAVLVGLLILGLLGLGGMLVIRGLGGGKARPPAITPAGPTATPTATKTPTPIPTFTPTITPTLVVSQASPTATAKPPSPTPTEGGEIPETGGSPFMPLIIGISLAALMAAARMARLK